MLLRAVSVTRRMHNKAWIADGRLAVVGGRNIGDAYFDAPTATANFRDLDLLVLGAAVRQAEIVFDDYWNSKAVIPIGALGKPRGTDLPEIRKELAGLTAGRARAPLSEPRRRGRERSRDACRQEADPLDGGRAGSSRIPPEKVKGAGQESWLMNVIRPCSPRQDRPGDHLALLRPRRGRHAASSWPWPSGESGSPS